MDILSPTIARKQRLAYAEAQRNREEAVLQALGHPAGRAFLAAELEAETRRLAFHDGQTHQALAHQLGRVEMLRDLAARLDRASQPRPTRTGD